MLKVGGYKAQRVGNEIQLIPEMKKEPVYREELDHDPSMVEAKAFYLRYRKKIYALRERGE